MANPVSSLKSYHSWEERWIFLLLKSIAKELENVSTLLKSARSRFSVNT